MLIVDFEPKGLTATTAFKSASTTSSVCLLQVPDVVNGSKQLHIYAVPIHSGALTVTPATTSTTISNNAKVEHLQLDMGKIYTDKKNTVKFYIRNDNPAAAELKYPVMKKRYFACDMDTTSLRLLHVTDSTQYDYPLADATRDKARQLLALIDNDVQMVLHVPQADGVISQSALNSKEIHTSNSNRATRTAGPVMKHTNSNGNIIDYNDQHSIAEYTTVLLQP
eukprot:10865-Heterococcus_DN1.PRE.1